MCTLSEEYIKTILKNVAIKLDIKDYDYEKKDFENIAQNYFGVLIPVLLRSNDREKPMNYHVVLKLAPTDERYRVSGAVTAMFAREVYIYSTVLQSYQNLQKSFPLELQYVMPKLYHVCNEYCMEAIVMENMCVKGYLPYSNSVFLDLNHIAEALKSLAKFYALSMILNAKEIVLYNEIKNTCVPLNIDTNKRFMDILIDRLKKAKKIFGVTSQIMSKLDYLLDNCVQCVDRTASSVLSLCVCHGDIWKENILFKYENGIPISACLIDYQTTRMSSPAFDVLFLIMTSTNTEFRKENFRQLLNIYYDTLNEILACENMSTKYSRETFEHDLKIVGPACFIIANTALWLSNGLQEEGHVRSKIQFTTVEEKVRATEKYKNIIKDIIEDLNSYGYL